MQACYEDSDIYEAQRITECWQIANSARASAAQGRHVILASTLKIHFIKLILILQEQTGDFNSIPTSNCYQILKRHGFMTDSWLEIHEQSLLDSQEKLENNELTPLECIQLFGITCDSPVNTWTKHFLKQEAYERAIGDRLDYIHYRRTPQLVCQSSKVVMEDYIPGTEWNYSDHYGVHSVFSIHDTHTTGEEPTASQLARPDFTHLLPTTLFNMITILERDLVQAKKTAHGHVRFFGLTVLMVLAAYAIQVALPVVYPESSALYATVLCGFVMIIFSVLATISLIVGFVFGRMEQRSLAYYLNEFKLFSKNGLQ